MLKPNHYSVLFTGGLDSTYRLCQLAQDETAVVQPVYIVCPDNGKSPHIRPELQREIEAQDKILEYICKHPNTKAKFLPIRRICRDDIPKDQSVMDLEPIIAKYKLGWQYLYICLLSKWMNELELCHEDYPFDILKNHMNMVKKGDTYILESTNDPTLLTLFCNVYWPIFGISRKTMKDNLIKWNYSDIFNYIVFCYSYIDCEPCGICDNCRKKIEEGLTFLFSKKAIHRYLVYKYIERFFPSHVRVICINYFKFENDNSIILFGKKVTEHWLSSIRKIDGFSDKNLKKILLDGSFKLSEPYFYEKIYKQRQDIDGKKHLSEILKKL